MASEPFADSDPTSRVVADDRLGEEAVRLAGRFGSFPSSDIFDRGLAVREGVSFSSRGDLGFEGIPGRTVLLDLDPSSRLDLKLDDDLGESVLIRIFVFPSFDFSSVPFSSRSPTGVPFRDDRWPSLVSGGLGGTSVRLWLLPFVPSFCSVKSVGSGVGMFGLTASLLWAFENVG